MGKIVNVPLAVLAGSDSGAAPTSTAADATMRCQLNSVMGTRPGTHTWTWLDSVFESGPPPDATLSNEVTHG